MVERISRKPRAGLRNSFVRIALRSRPSVITAPGSGNLATTSKGFRFILCRMNKTRPVCGHSRLQRLHSQYPKSSRNQIGTVLHVFPIRVYPRNPWSKCSFSLCDPCVLLRLNFRFCFPAFLIKKSGCLSVCLRIRVYP